MRILKIQIIFYLSCIYLNNSYANHINSPNIDLRDSHYIEISTNKSNCEKIVESNCIYRDNKTDENAYFHPTKLIIFKSKILALQQQNNNIKILKIKDSSYEFLTLRKNKVIFNVKNGKISDFRVKKGDLSLEKEEYSHCQETEFLYNFYQSYNHKKEINEYYGFFKDDYDKADLTEILVIESKDRKERIALTRKNGKDFKSTKNLKLCKFPNIKELKVKHISNHECPTLSRNECIRYINCKDYIEIDNCKISYFKHLNKIDKF